MMDIRALYDRFAPHFDRQLALLEYSAPALVGGMLRGRGLAGYLVPGAVLELGCGTGLGGLELAPFARHLVGIDLSAQMLRRAADRGIYQELVHAEMGAFLVATPRRWDLVAAIDSLVYLPELGPLIAAAAAVLAPGGHLVLTLERAAGAGVQASAGGRFAHGESSVRDAVAAAGLELAELEATEHLRREGPASVPGWIALTCRRRVT